MAVQTRDELIQRLKDLKEEIFQRWPVASIGLFGSWARGEATPSSDVDILVDFSGRITLLEFVDIKQHLETWLESPVDLVDKSALKPRLAPLILSDLIPL
jgi:predicted nucleotidyltransferase